MAMSLHWRAFASILAGLAMWPLAAHGQQSGNIPRVGIVWIAPQSVIAPFHEAFRQGLRDLGYVEGQTIVIEPRFADGKVEVLPAIAEELVRLKVDAIVAPSTASVRFLKQATTTIPIVMANVSDPVGFGFVASLQGPGTNITGFSNLMIEQVGKNVELSKELVPGLSRLAVLVNPGAPDAAVVLKETQAAARSLGVAIDLVEARQPSDFEGAICAGERTACQCAAGFND